MIAILRTLACLAACLLSCGVMMAADITWQGDPSIPARWDASANWTGGVRPGSSDNAYICNGGTALIPAGATGYGWQVAVGGAGSGSVIQSGTLNAWGLTVNSNGLYEIDNGSTPLSWWLGVSGAYVQKGGTVSCGSNYGLNLNAGGSAQISGGSLHSNTTNIGGNFHMTGGSFDTFYMRITSPTALITFDGGTFQGGSYLGWTTGAKIIQNNGTWTQDTTQIGGYNITGYYELNGGTFSGGMTIPDGATSSLIWQRGGTFKGSLGLTTGSYRLENGTANLTSLSGGGIVQTGGNMTVTGYASIGNVSQSGGTASFAKSLTTSGLYTLSGGNLAAAAETVGNGYASNFVQTGGSHIIGDLLVQNLGTYTFSGGSLEVDNSLRLLGPLDFANSAVTMTIGPGVTADVNNMFRNTSLATLNCGKDSLLLVPSGYDPNIAFAHFSTQGLVHNYGTPLTVPVGMTATLSGTFADPVVCQGTLRTPASTALTLSGGLVNSGSVNLYTGNVSVNDPASGMSAGSLAANNQYVGNTGVGKFVHSGGQTTLTYALHLGETATGDGDYELSTGGQVKCDSIVVGYYGKGLFHQTGGSVNANSVSVGSASSSVGTYQMEGGAITCNLESVSNAAGKFVQTGGSNTVSSSLSVTGTYQLGGVGVIACPSASVNQSGRFTQTGGTANFTQLFLYNSSNYSIQDGLLATSKCTMVDSTAATVLTQSGGTIQVDDLFQIGAKDSFQQSGGTLKINDSLISTDTIEFTGPGGLIQIADGGFVDLSKGKLLQLGNGSIRAGADALVILPPGTSTTQFKSYVNGGMTYVAGGTLTVPAGTTLRMRGKFDDPVLVRGSLTDRSSGNVTLNKRLFVSGGQVNVRSPIYVRDASSGMDSGSIAGLAIVVDGPAALFNQTGGQIVLSGWAMGDGLVVGTDGTGAVGGAYQLSGGSLQSGIEQLGLKAQGLFTQTGGTNTTDSFLIGYGGGSGTYDLENGQLAVNGLWMNSGGTASFVQRGGKATVNTVYLGAGTSRTISLEAGEFDGFQENIFTNGVFAQKGGTNQVYYLNIQSGGKYQYTGGEMLVGGWNIQGTWDFTGKTTTIKTADGAWIDFGKISAACLLNAQNVSFEGGANSLVIIPAGVNPASLFKSYSNAGMVYTPGTTLDIPASIHLKAAMTTYDNPLNIADHVRCAGGLDVGPVQSSYVNLQKGLEVLSAGSVNIGLGTLYADGANNCNYGGNLTLGTFSLATNSTGTFTQTGGATTCGSVAASPYTYASSFNLSGGSFTSTNQEQWGQNAAATITQTGGTHNFNVMNLAATGSGSGPRCTYTISGSSIINGQTFNLGYSGNAAFVQNGGQVNLSNLNTYSGSVSTYTLNSGGLATQAENWQQGFFTQNAGTHTVSDLLQFSGSSGFYLWNGSLTAGRENLASNFYQYNGQHTVAGLVAVGTDFSSGNFTMSGGTFICGSQSVGTSSYTGRLTQSGGTCQVLGGISVAGPASPPTDSAFVLSGGNLTCAGIQLLSYSAATKGTFSHTGGNNTVNGQVVVGTVANSSGAYSLSGSSSVLTAQAELVGCSGGVGAFTQSNGVNNVEQLTIGANGSYVYTGGSLNAGGVVLGGRFDLGGSAVTLQAGRGVFDATGGIFANAGSASFQLDNGSLLLVGPGGTAGWGFKSYVNNGLEHVAGTPLVIPVDRFLAGSGRLTDAVTLAGQVRLQSGSSLELAGGLDIEGGLCQANAPGKLQTTDLQVGVSALGRLEIADARANVVVSHQLTFGSGASVAMAPGAAIHMTGSDFNNAGTDPAALADMRNMTLIFEGGPGQVDKFEVAGIDLGAVDAGFENNFALGRLQVGGVATGNVKLADLLGNQPGWTGDEALYVQNLQVGAGSLLDLNGLHLYYFSAQIDPSATIVGGTPSQVPEPATLSLLALGGLALIRRRRR